MAERPVGIVERIGCSHLLKGPSDFFLNSRCYPANLKNREVRNCKKRGMDVCPLVKMHNLLTPLFIVIFTATFFEPKG